MSNPRGAFLQIFCIAGLIVGWSGPIFCARAEVRRVVAQAPAVLKRLTPAASLPGNTPLNLAIGLPLRNHAELDQLLIDLYDPNSPKFHQYLTPDQFAERFAPTEKDYDALIKYLKQQGLIVRARHVNRMVLEVEGEAAVIGAMLHTEFKLYQHPTERRTFYSPASDPMIAATLPVQDIQGLDDYVVPRPMSLRSSAAARAQPQALTGSAPDGSYRGNDFRAAYAPTVRLNGTGQVVGLLEFDGYYTNDIALYERDTGARSVPLQNVLLDGVNGVARADNPEVALDIETCISMAPGLSKVIVYEGSYGNTILSRMASDNAAKQLSSSWRYSINSTTAQLFAQLAAQGQSMFQASGDDDAYYNEIPPPSDNPNLTLVGGTVLTTSGPGGAWVSETTWNWGNGVGSSGGVSLTFSLPNWQKGISMTSNKGSTLQRNLPDVALTADHIWVRDNSGATEMLAGTSAAAPLWAGFMALVNQQSKSLGGTAIGFLNPALYTLGKGAKYGTSFHDITTGDNTDPGSPSKYFAVSGFDLCTGWGTPQGQRLINALTGVTNVAPVFLANSFMEPSASSGQAYSGWIAEQATDPDPGDRLSFFKTSGPAWLNVSTNGFLSGTPGTADLGTNTFGVKVTDVGGLSANATMAITVVGAPTFLVDPFREPTVNAGTSYGATISTNATDPNPGATLIFSKLSGPGWLAVASDGALSGEPAAADAGTNWFSLSVRDSVGYSNSATMYLLVNGAPYFFSSALLEPPANAGQPYAASIVTQARDPNAGDILAFSKLSGPSWLNLSTAGILSGTPSLSDGGTNIFAVEVMDSGGLTNGAQMFVYVAIPTPVSLQIGLEQSLVRLSWTGGSGRYQIQASADLAKPNWVDVGPLLSIQSLALPLTNATFFYRVESQ